MKVTKLDAFKAQIISAIEMYFLDKDPISMHTLMGTSRVIIIDLCSEKGIEVGMLSIIKKDKIKELERILRAPQNFFKHADRDGDDEIEFNPDLTPFLMYDSLVMYDALAKSGLTKEMKIFNINFHITHKDLISDEVMKKTMNDKLLKIGDLPSKREYWELLNEAFEGY